MQNERIMKRLIAIILFVCCNCSLIVAQSFNEIEAIQEISRVAASIKTLKCDFVQTKNLKMIGDKMVSKGVMYCSQPNQLRWEYLSPYTYTFILNENQVLLKKGIIFTFIILHSVRHNNRKYSLRISNNLKL